MSRWSLPGARSHWHDFSDVATWGQWARGRWGRCASAVVAKEQLPLGPSHCLRARAAPGVGLARKPRPIPQGPAIAGGGWQGASQERDRLQPRSHRSRRVARVGEPGKGSLAAIGPSQPEGSKVAVAPVIPPVPPGLQGQGRGYALGCKPRRRPHWRHRQSRIAARDEAHARLRAQSATKLHTTHRQC